MFRFCACVLAVAASLSQASVGAQPPKPPQRPAPVSPAPKKPATPPPAKAVVKPPEPPKYVPPDLQFVAAYTTGDTTTTSTVQLKGVRARIGLGDTLASLLQCDRTQTVQLNTQTRTFIAVPFPTDSSSAPTVSSEPRKKGGEVIYKTTVTDTGDVQPMFGFTARHVKTVVVVRQEAAAR
jgi:hypothetical protein